MEIDPEAFNREELDDDKSIEPHQLDVECVRQADTFFKWAERLTHANAEVDRLEYDIDLLEAKLQLECRQYPDRFGLSNVTDTAIKSAVKAHKKMEPRIRHLMRAKVLASLLSKAVSAMEQKKRMIEVLITLHGQEYFAGPSVPRNLVDAWKDYTKKRGESLNDRQRARTRRVQRNED